LHVNWGDIPSGVGAILTGLSLLIAALSYRRSVRNSEMDQAKLVTAWIENEDAIPYAIIVVHNASNLPIYMVDAYLDDEETLKRFYIGTIFPGATSAVTTNISLTSALPPDKIGFIDAAGRQWTRSEDGALLSVSHHHNFAYFAEAARHPFQFVRYLTPERFAMPLPINERTQARALEVAAQKGIPVKRTRSVLSKYMRNQRLTLSEKRVLVIAMSQVPALRDCVPSGLATPGESQFYR
jgi:hypothetical protein